MTGLRVTRRGWVVLALTAVLFSATMNWAMAGKSVSCDWTTHFEPCSIVEGP